MAQHIVITLTNAEEREIRTWLKQLYGFAPSRRVSTAWLLQHAAETEVGRAKRNAPDTPESVENKMKAATNIIEAWQRVMTEK